VIARVVSRFAPLLVIAACNGGGGMDAGTSSDADVECPNIMLPSACPTPAPSFDGSVFALIQERCAICHHQGGLSGDKPMSTYGEIKRLQGPMLDQVYRCAMPPDGGPIGQPLSESEKLELLTWLGPCAASNN
jgi:hypothetical protein